MRMIIDEVENGYLVKILDEDEDGNFITKKIVIEEPDDEDGELISMKNLLYIVKENFGVFYNKHNKKNLVIDIKDTKDE